MAGKPVTRDSGRAPSQVEAGGKAIGKSEAPSSTKTPATKGMAAGVAVGMAVAHLLHLLLHNSGESTAAINRLPAKITYGLPAKTVFALFWS